MSNVENLEIVIDIVDNFSRELDQLLFKLGKVEVALQAVDDHTINVDVDDSELDVLAGKMAAMGMGDAGGFGGAPGGFGGSGGRRGTGRAMAKAAKNAEEGFQAMNLRMSDVHNAMARMVPILLVLIGALPAAIGGLVALAGAAVAAAGALGALGAFAAAGAAMQRGGGDMMAGFEEMLEELQQDFMDAFTPLMERLAPLFRDAMDGLDRLFQRIANEADAFLMLRDQARAFGGWVLDVLPSLLADISMFVDAASQALGQVTDALGDIDIFGMLAGILADTLPMLMRMGEELAGLIAHIYELSLGFMVVANAVLSATNTFIDIITLGGMLTEEIGLLVGALLAAWTATLILNSSLFTLAYRAIVAAAQRMVAFGAMVQSVGVKTAVTTAAVKGLRTALLGLAAVISITGLGLLAGLVGGVGSVFSSTSSEIDSATESLKEFENQRQSMSDGNNPYRNPDITRGDRTGQSRFAPGRTTINNEFNGDVSDETVRKQSNNTMYRLERPQRR